MKVTSSWKKKFYFLLPPCALFSIWEQSENEEERDDKARIMRGILPKHMTTSFPEGFNAFAPQHIHTFIQYSGKIYGRYKEVNLQHNFPTMLIHAKCSISQVVVPMNESLLCPQCVYISLGITIFYTSMLLLQAIIIASQEKEISWLCI